MPAIPPASKVLVTGASGFIAVWVCQAIIDRGHSVIGTVRSTSKGEYLKKVLGDKFSYTIVPDIEKAGAFDESLKLGLDAVVHVASPVILDAEDPATVIGPAVQGTIGILEAIQKYGTSVKRVVITASVCSIIEPKDVPSYTFTEKDWNNYSAGLVEREGKQANGFHKYRTSKVLAERAAWAFMENNKLPWDLITFLPPEVYGPLKHDVKDVASLNTTSTIFREIAFNPDYEYIDGLADNLVDVRDVGIAHALALDVEEAGGERFLVSADKYTFQTLRDEIIAAGFKGTVKGTPGSDDNHVYPRIMDGSKAERILGLKYRPTRETIVDTLNSLNERFPKEP